MSDQHCLWFSVSCRNWKFEMFFVYLVQLAGSYQGQENLLARIPKKVHFQKQFICCYVKEACGRYKEQTVLGFLTAWSLQNWGQKQSWMKQVVHILFVYVFPWECKLISGGKFCELMKNWVKNSQHLLKIIYNMPVWYKRDWCVQEQRTR
jgi:hypothetical protein